MSKSEAPQALSPLQAISQQLNPPLTAQQLPLRLQHLLPAPRMHHQLPLRPHLPPLMRHQLQLLPQQQASSNFRLSLDRLLELRQVPQGQKATAQMKAAQGRVKLPPVNLPVSSQTASSSQALAVRRLQEVSLQA